MRKSSTLIVLVSLIAACSGDKDKKPAAAPDKTPATAGKSTPGGAPVAEPKMPPPGAQPPTALTALSKAANCADPASVWRVWCIPATGFATGTAADIPAGSHFYAGVTVEIQDGTSAADALRDKVSLSALGLRADGSKITGKIITVTPSNDDENKVMAEAVMNLTMVFKDKSKVARIDKGLHTYLSELPAKAEYPVAKAANGWKLAGASAAELRKVGDYWVAVEHPDKGGGAFISVFTDKVEAKK